MASRVGGILCPFVLTLVRSCLLQLQPVLCPVGAPGHNAPLFDLWCRKRRLNLALVFLCFFVLYYISFDWCVRAFVVLGLVFSTPSQEIGLWKRLRNDLFSVEWDVKPQLSQAWVGVYISYKCIAVRKVATQLRELTCHMRSHSVTCHLAEVTFQPLPQPKLVLD